MTMSTGSKLSKCLGRRAFFRSLLMLFGGALQATAPTRIIERSGWLLDESDR